MAAKAETEGASRAPLTRERILAAAIELADDGGIESLTMRKLGQALGVEAMSLYNHVANKRDVLAGIVDLVMREVELPSGDGDWAGAIRASALSAHDALERHGWASDLMLSRVMISPARVRYMDSLLRRLRQAGFPPDETYHAYHALDAHIFGFSMWQAGHTRAAAAASPDLHEKFLLEFPPDEYPYVAEHIGQHVADGPHRRFSTFAFVLDMVLDGLERSR